MIEAYHKRRPQPKTILKLKEMLQSIWDSLPQEPIDIEKAVKEFGKHLKACVAAGGGHFEYTKLNILGDCGTVTHRQSCLSK